MIKKFLYHILFFVLLLNAHIHAIIIESNKLEDVYKYADKNSVVIFDIDNTIAKVAHGIEPWVKHKTAELVKKGLSHKEAFEFVLCMFFVITDFTKLLPIGNAPTIIKNLQDKGIPVIALTKRSMPFSKTTIRQIRDMGIDFSINGLCNKNLNLPATYVGGFSHGIIFTGSNKKGEILSSFFNKIHCTPKKIIFIDDGMNHVISVEKMCKKNNIEFVGIRFSLMDKMKKDFTLAAAKKYIHALKIKAGFEPLGSVAQNIPEKKIGWAEYIWNGIIWPFKKMRDLFA